MITFERDIGETSKQDLIRDNLNFMMKNCSFCRRIRSEKIISTDVLDQAVIDDQENFNHFKETNMEHTSTNDKLYTKFNAVKKSWCEYRKSCS